ncbi:MAG: hypothetical protein ACKOA5_13125 [Actinomycetota bacterium]
MTNDEIFERIARIDPVPADTHFDPATSSRARELKGLIMSSEPQENAIVAKPRRIGRLITAGAVAVGAVAVVVAVTRARSGDDAEPIVFSAAQSSLSSRTAAGGESTADAAMPNNKMAAVAPYEVEYEVEGDLPALDDKAQSWKSKGAPSKKQMNSIVKALGVEGDLVARKKDEGGGFVAGPIDGSAPSVSFGDAEFDPYLNWYYSAAWATSSRSSEPAVAPDTATSDSATSDEVVEVPVEMKKPENLPSKDEARDRAKSIMSDAGVDVRDDDIEVYADEWSVSVTAWTRVGEVRAPMSWTFGFGDEGAITWAGGNLLSFEKGPKFPRIGALAGVERLGDPKYSGWYGYGPVAKGVTEPAFADDSAAVAPSPAGDATTTDSVVPTVQTVVITGVNESLTPIIDADNVMWLVPSYEYTVKDGYTISALAITDEFIEQATPTPDTAAGGGTSGSAGSSGVSEGSGGSAGSGETLPVVDVPALSQEEAVKLVGLTEDEAVKVAESNGWITRVSSRDGEDFQLTMDYVTNRVNLAIVDGKVTGVSVG